MKNYIHYFVDILFLYIQKYPLFFVDIFLLVFLKNFFQLFSCFAQLLSKKVSTVFVKNFYSILQSISFNLFFFKNSLVLENGLLPKKPFLAENGEGWADSII